MAIRFTDVVVIPAEKGDRDVVRLPFIDNMTLARRRKVAVSIRLDEDVVAKFKAGGPGWQTRINAALRKAL
jgi:uncharacterized protein (DUF4415 family)